jgi:hypothetical protein
MWHRILWLDPHSNLKVSHRPLRLERLEDRTLLALAPADTASNLAPGAASSEFLASCPLYTGQNLPGLALAAGAPLTATVQGGSPLSVPPRHSDPNASVKLFLDFDGHFEASWGDRKNVNTPAFDLDYNLASFSSSEQAAIDEIWTRVAEDYAPFKIDVTTVDPGTYAHGRVAVIAIGGDYSDWYGENAGGVAYVGGFATDSSAPNVGFVFSRTLNNVAKPIADAASHEAGHLFGLNHQSVWNGNSLVEEYNPGNNDWAPIMGASYDATRSTWHNGTPDSSATLTQDDMAIIAGPENGFGYRLDDYGDTLQTAAALPVTDTNVSFSGLIGRADDRDVWAFTTTAGQIGFELTGVQYGSNLDGELELWDSNGSLIASNNPSDSLNAKFGAQVVAGTYYLVARGAGDYGDAGQYTITGTLAAPEIDVSVDGVVLPNYGAVDFGNPAPGASVIRTITITNLGNATLTLTPFDWSQKFGVVTLLSNIGTDSLAPGESTTFTLQFKATTEIAFSDFIQLANNDIDEGPYWLNLRASVNLPNPWGIDVAVNGFHAVNGQFFNFGSTPRGVPITKTFTVTNQGTAPLTLNPLNPNIESGFTLVSNLGSTVLGPGESTDFQVRLDATFGGGFDCNIYFNGDRSGSQFRLWFEAFVGQTIDVVLHGQSVMMLGGVLDFGRSTLGSWHSKTITVVNRGSSTLSLSPLSPGDMPSGFTLVSNLAVTSLAPGQSTFFVVRLDTTVVGAFTGTIHLVNNDSDEDPYELTVTGRVTPPPGPEIDLTIGGQSISDGGTLNFGSTIQGNSVTTTITVTNQGSTRLNLTPLKANNMPSGFSLLSNIGRTSLALGESTSFTIRFNAATVGVMSGAIHLVNNDSDESSYDLTLGGAVTTSLGQVIDDGDANNMLAGNWKQQTGAGFARDNHYTSRGKGLQYASWAFNGLPQGFIYNVYATWTSNRNHASNAPYELLDGPETRTVARVNQRLAPGGQTVAGTRWKFLSTVTVTSGQLVVKLTNAANGFVVADAVRIEQVIGVIAQPEIINVGAGSTPFISKTSAAPFGQPPANASDLASLSALLPPAATTSSSPGQSTAPAAGQMTTSAQAADTVGLANAQAVDGIVTRLPKRETETPSSIIDLLVCEQSTSHHEAIDNSVAIRDELLTSLLTNELPHLVS